jgi:hypothetical protein
MMFLAGADTPQYIPMQNMSSRDMQMMEYLKWTLQVKCACYQISTQDVGFVTDYHRTTSQTQRQISKERGIKNLLSLLETYFNTEIVKKEFPFQDVKFQWQGIDLQDEQVQSTIDIQDINAGVISRNDRRKRIGLPPVDGGDTILVNVGQQFVPIEDLTPQEETPEAEQPMEEALKEKEAEGKPTQLPNEQAEARQTAIDNTTKPSGKPAEAKDKIPEENKQAVKEQLMDDEAKAKIVRMIVNYTKQDKIVKAMDALKSQGMGENEVKITLEG